MVKTIICLEYVGFPELGGISLGFPIIRIRIDLGLCWRPLFVVAGSLNIRRRGLISDSGSWSHSFRPLKLEKAFVFYSELVGTQALRSPNLEA